MEQTFQHAAKFKGIGLDKWVVAKVTNMANTFHLATGLTSCNKRKIADAWTPIGTVFAATSYDEDWAADTCLCTAGSTWSVSGSEPCAVCAADATCGGAGGVETACTSTTDTVCNDGPCAAGATFSTSGNTPCALCAAVATCTAGVKTVCTTTLDTVCNVST